VQNKDKAYNRKRFGSATNSTLVEAIPVAPRPSRPSKRAWG
jgi:hypothetical protein